MTHEQQSMLRFAKRHDWGHDAQPTADGGVLVGEWIGNGNTGEWVREWAEVRTMSELRDWAGY